MGEAMRDSEALRLKDDDLERLASFVGMGISVAALVERVENLSKTLDEVKRDIKGNLVDPADFAALCRRVDWVERKMLIALGALGVLNVVLYMVGSGVLHLGA